MVMVEAFRKKFGNQPDEYAFKGYDIIQFYLRNLIEGAPEYRGIVLGFKPNKEGKIPILSCVFFEILNGKIQ